jgi:hypothetical protein
MATSKKSNSRPARRSTPARSVETVDAAPAQAQPQASTRNAARDAAPAEPQAPRASKRSSVKTSSSVKTEATPSRSKAKVKPTPADTTGRPIEPGKATTERDARVRELAYLLAESNHFAGDPAFYWRVAAQLQERA